MKLADDTGGLVAPGHYPEMTNEQYHSGPGVSKTHLDTIHSGSPKHYWAKHLDPDREPEKDTPAKVLGDAIHKAILEPDLFTSQFAAWRGPSRSTKAGKAQWAEFAAENLGRTVLTGDQFDSAIACRDAAYREPTVRSLMSRGKSEQTYFATDPETGELIKCRLDWDRLESDGLIIDIKSTENAKDEDFGRDANNYRYYVQGAFYPYVVSLLGATVHNFCFIAIEKENPWAIGAYTMEPEDMGLGLYEAMADLRKIHACREQGYWPDYIGMNGIKPLTLPRWKRKNAA